MASERARTIQGFMTALRFAGGNARRVGSGFEAAAAIEAVAHETDSSRSVLYEPFDLAQHLGLPLALSARGFRLVPVAQAGDVTSELRVGLTGAALGIAESGTLLVGGTNGGWGLATVLPWVHVAVLRAQDIVPDLSTAFGLMCERFDRGDRNWVWITGPSKTADIAKTLVMGIHGPNSLEVLIVDDDGAGQASR